MTTTQLDQETQLVEYDDRDALGDRNVPDSWSSLHSLNPMMPNYEIAEEILTIGRRGCQINIPDKRISSTHCKIVRNKERRNIAMLVDMRFQQLLFSFIFT